MRFGKKEQNALLLVAFLRTNGQARIQDVSEHLKLSATFLEQIARKLRIAGIIESIRGPGGGYKLKGNPNMYNVLQALDSVALLSFEEFTEMAARGPVGEAVAKQLDEIQAAVGLKLMEKS